MLPQQLPASRARFTRKPQSTTPTINLPGPGEPEIAGQAGIGETTNETVERADVGL